MALLLQWHTKADFFYLDSLHRIWYYEGEDKHFWFDYALSCEFTKQVITVEKALLIACELENRDLASKALDNL